MSPGHVFWQDHVYGVTISFVIMAGVYGEGAISRACLKAAVNIGIDLTSVFQGFGIESKRPVTLLVLVSGPRKIRSQFAELWSCCQRLMDCTQLQLVIPLQ